MEGKHQNGIGIPYQIASMRQQARHLWAQARALEDAVMANGIQTLLGELVVQKTFDQVFAMFNYSVNELISKGRKGRLSFSRHVAVYMLRELTPLSYPEIGRLFQRDHTTAMHSHDVIRKRTLSSPEFARTMERALGAIRAEVAKESYAAANHVSGGSVGLSPYISEHGLSDGQAAAVAGISSGQGMAVQPGPN